MHAFYPLPLQAFQGLLPRSTPQHGAATTMVNGGDGVLVMMCSDWFLTNIVSDGQKPLFGLIRLKNLLPVDLGFSHMLFVELWLRFYELSSTVAFSLPSHKALTGEEPRQQLLYAESFPSQLEMFLYPSLTYTFP